MTSSDLLGKRSSPSIDWNDSSFTNTIMSFPNSFTRSKIGEESLVDSKNIGHEQIGNIRLEFWAMHLRSKTGAQRILLITQIGTGNPDISQAGWYKQSRTIRAAVYVTPEGTPKAARVGQVVSGKYGYKEFMRFVKDKVGFSLPASEKTYMKKDQTGDANLTIKHRKAVAKAIEDGLTVPKKVLDEYPEMRDNKPGSPAFFVAKHSIEESSFHAEPGDKVSRVVFQKPGNFISTHKASALNLGNGEDVYALHVTSDEEYWVDRLAKDYDKDADKAWTIDIVVGKNDVLVEDHQYAADPDGNDKADSAILLTDRKILKKDQDFFVNGKFAN